MMFVPHALLIGVNLHQHVARGWQIDNVPALGHCLGDVLGCLGSR